MVQARSVELVKAVVHGDKYLHLVRRGEAITLCGMVGDYPHRWMPERDMHGVCVRIAHDHDLALPC